MKKLSLFLVLLAALLSFSGCEEERHPEENGNIKIYYLNSSETALVYETDELDGDSVDEKVNAMVAFLDRTPEDPTNKKVKPESVLIQDWKVEDGVVTINFSPSYSVIDKNVEILVRAAIVRDFCQIEGITGVKIQVGGRPLTDRNGTSLETMKDEDFIDILNRNKNEYRNMMISVYFATGNENEIASVQLKLLVPADQNREEIIVEQLIAGPNVGLQAEGFLGTIASDCKINKIITKNDTCYVDLNEKFLENPSGISVETKVYSVVNSITAITEINKVKITVNGETYKQISELETDGFLFENPGIIRE